MAVYNQRDVQGGTSEVGGEGRLSLGQHGRATPTGWRFDRYECGHAQGSHGNSERFDRMRRPLTLFLIAG